MFAFNEYIAVVGKLLATEQIYAKKKLAEHKIRDGLLLTLIIYCFFTNLFHEQSEPVNLSRSTHINTMHVLKVRIHEL